MSTGAGALLTANRLAAAAATERVCELLHVLCMPLFWSYTRRWFRFRNYQTTPTKRVHRGDTWARAHTCTRA
eukprot:4071714-Prymnesium_polylepis.1